MDMDDVPPTVRYLAEYVRNKALIGIQQEQEIEPLLLIFREEKGTETGFSKTVGIIPLNKYMSSEYGKDFIKFLMVDTIKQEEIDIVIMIAEAWLAILPADSITQEEAHRVKVSERPDKQEILMLNIMTKTHQYLGTSKIVREPSPTLEPMEIYSTTEDSLIEGRLVRDKDDTPKIH
ncbi:MAG TPA: hypothetical protein VNS62_05990 [Candidatus Udaeobacter sp.]|nr:hypothetical protein [Candidatus Udaeobacter sp.]